MLSQSPLSPKKRNAFSWKYIKRFLVLLGMSSWTIGYSSAQPITLENCQRIDEKDSGRLQQRHVAKDVKAPESSTGYRADMSAVVAAEAAVVTANPYATQAGCDILRKGGSALDAAIAVQLTLGLVEPQSSGLGGGGFLLYYDASSRDLVAYDGRETAPAAATPDYLRWVQAGHPESGAPLPNVRRSGRSIGVPGVVRMLDLAHQKHGRLAWSELSQFALGLAEQGFVVSPRLSQLIAVEAENLKVSAEASDYFFDEHGQPLPSGFVRDNPAYAKVLQQMSSFGPDIFYTGEVAQAILEAVHQTLSADGTQAVTPGFMQKQDITGYQPVVRRPICTQYREQYEVCGMPPPGSGGIAIAQVLGILEALPHALLPPTQVDRNGGLPHPQSIHLMAEALNLAFADRNKYVADWDEGHNEGLELPHAEQMIDADYLKERAAQIQLHTAMGVARAGTFPLRTTQLTSSVQEGVGTTHISIVDPQGNAVALTSTIEGAFGSYHMTQGFLLNNQLTDFSIEPVGADGPVANRIESGKRPRSSMSPTIVLTKNEQGERENLVLITGSPGGAAIIAYTLKSIVATLDWHLNAQQAAGLMNFNAMNQVASGQTIPTLILDADFPLLQASKGKNDSLIQALIMQHGRPVETVSIRALNSGISTLLRTHQPDGKVLWGGGADPRREGIVLGF